MALDGAFLSRLAHEIEAEALGSRVDKIYQPSREEIILQLRAKSGNQKLLISASADSPRVHFTCVQVENPKSPPMFCMLMRKHLTSAKLLRVQQIGIDRIVHLVFETVNELGDTVEITLAVEIMGRHSNIIMVDQHGKIIDSVKRINDEMSSVRPILPGMAYTLPPAQDKLNLFDCEAGDVIERIGRSPRNVELSKSLMENLQGVSQLLCREVAFYTTHGRECLKNELGEGERDRLLFSLKNLIQTIRDYSGTPTMVLETGGKPRDFSFIPIHQYGHTMLTKAYETYSGLLDAFYGERDAIERMKQRSNDLLKLLSNTTDRITRKIAAQREELKTCGEREQLKIFGDLISANMYQLERGQSVARVIDFYDSAQPEIEIALDPLLTPVQNSQKYYSEYRKADTAEKMLVSLLEKGELELLYLDSVFDMLTRARSEGELNAIREELAEEGYVRLNRAKNKKPERLSPLKYCSSDGFTILAGRNNVQNDKLTLKDSFNYDVWFHTQKIPGSHVIVVCDGKEVPDRTLEEAAVIAAHNSKARGSAQVPVDYTLVKNIKKPNGAKPGMVIYETYQTAYVTPDEELVARLAVK